MSSQFAQESTLDLGSSRTQPHKLLLLCGTYRVDLRQGTLGPPRHNDAHYGPSDDGRHLVLAFLPTYSVQIGGKWVNAVSDPTFSHWARKCGRATVRWSPVKIIVYSPLPFSLYY